MAHNLWSELNDNINSFLMNKSLKEVLNSRLNDSEKNNISLIATG